MVAERVGRTPACNVVTSPNLRADIFDPRTLAAMDQPVAAVWRMLRADDPFRDYASDTELRIAIGKKLLKLVADGVTDPLRLRNLTGESPAFAMPETRVVHTRRKALEQYRRLHDHTYCNHQLFVFLASPCCCSHRPRPCRLRRFISRTA